MPDDRLPDRYPPTAPAGRPPRPPARVDAGQPASQTEVSTYAPGGLEFINMPDREECWSLLGETLRQRLLARAGSLLDWWALGLAGDRTLAVVLGSTGLVVARPITRPDGRRAHALQVTPLNAASFRHQEIRQQPRRWSGSGSGGTSASAGPLDDPRLDPTMRGFLGHLPAKAQRFLQEPFSRKVEPVRYDHYYFQRTVGSSKELFAACYLADSRSVTFASGTRHTVGGQSEHDGTWHMVCRRAAVDPVG